MPWCGNEQTMHLSATRMMLFAAHRQRRYIFETAFILISPTQRSYTMSTKDSFIAAMKTQLDDLNTSLGEMEEGAKKAQKDGDIKYKAEMARLHDQSKLAMEKFDELRIAGNDSWARLVMETEKMRDAFIHSFQELKTQI
jgi:hypothetical protein